MFNEGCLNDDKHCAYSEGDKRRAQPPKRNWKHVPTPGLFFCEGARPWKVQKKCLQGRLINGSSGYLYPRRNGGYLEVHPLRFNDSNIGVLRGRFLSIEGGIKTDMVKYGAFIGQYA